MLLYDRDNLISAEASTFLQVRLHNRMSYNSRSKASTFKKHFITIEGLA